MKKSKTICVPAGYTTVWKEGKKGKLRPIIVKRKAYCRKTKSR